MTSVAREQVIDLIDELPSESLPEPEAPLAAIVHRRLPAEDQRRLSLLRARSEDGQLTPEEHAELLAYVERVEGEDAERVAALVELARRRNMPLGALMTALGSSSGSNA